MHNYTPAPLKRRRQYSPRHACRTAVVRFFLPSSLGLLVAHRGGDGHLSLRDVSSRSALARCGFWGLVSSTRRIPKLRAESQQIAAWKLLYRVQHPARYVSRLQTIPSSDIERRFTHGRPPEAGRTWRERSRRRPGAPCGKWGSCDGRR